MNLILPWLASWTCHLVVAMLILSCNALWWVNWACKDAFIILFMPCSVFLLSVSVYETCYVYMGAIISSVPFWLMISKELLFYAFSRFMPCLCLLRHVLVACCKLALKLLNNVSVSLLTWSSVLTCVLLVIHAPYDHDIAILSFIFMPSYCWLPRHAM